jgi:hypothetical protein
MVTRPPHAYGGFWPNLLERGYRIVVVEYVNPDDLENPAIPPSNTIANPTAYLKRADVTGQMTTEDILALVPDRQASMHGFFVNYWFAHDSAGDRMDANRVSPVS